MPDMRIAVRVINGGRDEVFHKLLARPRLRPSRCRGSEGAVGERRLGPTRPRYRILEKQNHLMMNARIWKKLDSSASGFAFKDSRAQSYRPRIKFGPWFQRLRLL